MQCTSERDSLQSAQSYYSSEHSSTTSVVAPRKTKSKNKMAASFDKLEKKIDKFERFFSKKKKVSSAARDSMFCRGDVSHFLKSQLLQHDNLELSPLQALSITSPTTSHLNSPPQLFPSPSFIRPTTTRMKAREEAQVKGKLPERRAKSLPENPTISHSRLPSIDESKSSSLILSPAPSSFASRASTPSLLFFPPDMPTRTSSLSPRRRRDPSVAGLLEFSFNQSKRLPDTPTNRLSIDSSSPRGSIIQTTPSKKSGQLLEALPVIPNLRPDTPPSSDNEDCSWLSSSFNKPVQVPSAGANLTPEPSPKMAPTPSRIPIPVARTLSRTPRRVARPASIETMTVAQKHRSLEEPYEASSNVAASSRLRKTVSDSTLSRNAPKTKSSQAPVLTEPTFHDFLKLSDDDIADDIPEDGPKTPSGKPPSFGLPPNPPVSPPSTYASSPGSKYGPLITLKHSLSGRPAAHGAYTCARICKQFNFDLVYVVNLWPATNNPSAPSSPTFPRSPQSKHTLPRPRMTGRILAAHGLQNVPAPFQIGENAHNTILRNKGWRKWMNGDDSPQEYAQGYAYAFYNDANNTTPSTPNPNPVTTISTGSPPSRARRHQRTLSQQDGPRGIVFAAYRTPRPDGTTTPLKDEDLAKLFLEAEALVETLLDIHKTQRARIPTTTTSCVPGGGAGSGAEDTGPLPARLLPNCLPVMNVGK